MRVVGDMGSKWAIFKVFISVVAACGCGQKVADACCGIKQRSCWCTPFKKEAVKLIENSLKA